VQESGYVARHDDALNAPAFILVSAIPKFLRFGISPEDLDKLSPYNAAFGYGFDTYMPVGGMSGFATLCYLSNPFLLTLALVMIVTLLIRFTPAGVVKHIIVLVFCIDAIHFWRDPVDIAVKDVVQDIFCALVLVYFPAIRTAPRPKPALLAQE
jgi:hypothetical protein